MKKIFTKEMLINSGITFAVVLGALAAHDAFIRPRMNANKGGNGSTPVPPAPPEGATDEEA